jgi:hypothetical protein
MEDMSVSVMLVYGGYVDCVAAVVLLGYREEDVFNSLVVIVGYMAIV